jgi:hypothetical protein
MFCKYCGKKIDDQSNFCKFCGESLNKNNEKCIPKIVKIYKRFGELELVVVAVPNNTSEEYKKQVVAQIISKYFIFKDKNSPLLDYIECYEELIEDNNKFVLWFIQLNNDYFKIKHNTSPYTEIFKLEEAKIKIIGCIVILIDYGKENNIPFRDAIIIEKSISCYLDEINKIENLLIDVYPNYEEEKWDRKKYNKTLTESIKSWKLYYISKYEIIIKEYYVNGRYELLGIFSKTELKLYNDNKFNAYILGKALEYKILQKEEKNKSK